MRKLAIVLVILLAIPLLHYVFYNAFVVRRSSSAAVAALNGVDLVSELTRRVPAEPWITSVRTKPGNAAVEYQKAFYGGEVTDEKVTMVESGAEMQSCLFTSIILPVPDNLMEMPIPNLQAARKYGELMIEKARSLEQDGDAAAAEKELLFLVSFGNHMEGEYTMISFLVGLDRQKAAADHLQGLYERQGQTQKARDAAAYSKEMERLRASYKKWLPTVATLTSDKEGRDILRKLYNSPMVPRALKSEIIFYNAMQHLYYFTGVIYGPGSDRWKFREELMQTSDPILREFAEKSDSMLNLPIRERLRAVHHVEEIK